MDKKVKVSVILPSLNVAAYIRECMESVIHQTMEELEIICVDAGSTDGTMEILREYAIKDERIRIILSDRRSYGYQMNIGMAEATGEYVGIVETDDFIPPDMCEDLYSTAKEAKADFVKADFFRFTGEGDRLHKIWNHLAEDASYYNRVIDIEKEQECFFFPMNTWCGIYNRRFLQKYHILHNETPGASYQDNGFWFQTFMYAKRAYFINRPYYMNRRDNAGSSVFSDKKLFCIRDEFCFILDILKKDRERFEKFKNIYTCICYRAYKANLVRNGRAPLLIFLKQFSEDFQSFYRQGMLNKKMYTEAEWSDILSIMECPEYYDSQNLLPYREMYDRIREYEDIIIYGAGAIGRDTLNRLFYNVEQRKIRCFAVSSKEGNEDFWQGVPICAIHELQQYRRKSLVIIAVAKGQQADIHETLRRLGFQHVLVVPGT